MLSRTELESILTNCDPTLRTIMLGSIEVMRVPDLPRERLVAMMANLHEQVPALVGHPAADALDVEMVIRIAACIGDALHSGPKSPHQKPLPDEVVADMVGRFLHAITNANVGVQFVRVDG